MRTRYEVEGWGVGELWTDTNAVLAHDFDFAFRSGSDPGAPAASRDATSQRQGLHGDTLDPDELAERLSAFLAGDDVALGGVPLELGLSTPFQHDVTRALRAIPRGDVVTYGELAAIAGYPGAQRAVGSVCAGNRFMFLVPCHRVVAADGIGRYGSAGVAVKRRLLALEGVEL